MAGDPKRPPNAVENQTLAIVRVAPTGHGMDVLDHATQIRDTATFWKRCGAATTECG